jgi:ABC-2 type transport system ATP-binding protein
MSIRVEQLTKIYEEQKAVNAISFEIKKGEIVGFLGPNGAGKSTTMKMITSFVTPTEGNTFVCDINVQEQPLAARKKIGYLPEHNPIYLEMYVEEYLEFVARINKIDGSITDRVNEMIRITGLERERKKKIEQLSKGFRQRVGLASALIHDPEVLILDEPTTGLDPNQILEIRGLIKEISKNKTIMLSSHIMQEIQALCDRVIIINKGDIIANTTIEDIQQKDKSTFIIQLEVDGNLDEDHLSSNISSIQKVRKNNTYCTIEADTDIRKALFEYCIKEDLILLTLNMEKQSLEAVFQALTK